MAAPSINNPYMTKLAMGPQSQFQLSLKERTFKLSANNNKRKATGQVTLFGEEAIEPLKHCPVCKAKDCGLPLPQRPHHKLCWNNRRTKGIVSETTLRENQRSRQLQQHFAAPLTAAENASWRHSTKESSERFFAPRKSRKKEQPMTTENDTTTMKTPPAKPPPKKIATETVEEDITASLLCKMVTDKVNDSTFVQENVKTRALLAMMAFAGIVCFVCLLTLLRCHDRGGQMIA
jgi:hypothetical protein